MTENTESGFFCIDENDLYVGGHFSFQDAAELYFILTPCNYLHTDYGQTDDYVSQDCVADLNEQIDYLGPIELVMLAN